MNEGTKCYQWLQTEAGSYQPECSYAKCAKWCSKAQQCADTVTALSLSSIKWIMNHPNFDDRGTNNNVRSEDVPF